MQIFKPKKDKEISKLGKHTLEKKLSEWEHNVIENEKLYGFKQTIEDDFLNKHKNERTIIFSAGCHKDWLKRDNLKQIYSANPRPLVIACDHSLPLFVDSGYTPDYVVSVDGSPLIAKYFWRKLRDKPKGVLLHTTTHPLTTEMITEHGYPIYWFQHKYQKEMESIWRKGVAGANPCGNVGTTAWNLALVFGCKPIGLLDIEFAWSDETPYRENDHISRLGYSKVWNPLTESEYVADYVYGIYLKSFGQFLNKITKEDRDNTICLTKEGIIHKTGIKYQSLEEFINSKLVV